VDIDSALAFATANRQSILVTLKQDGRPQTSNVMHVVRDGVIEISVTADRAKTRNAARDPRVSLHVLGPDFWSYVVLDCDADLMPVAADPHDATVEALVGYYRSGVGEHPDWDEYRSAMVADRRLLMRLRPVHAYGMTPR
jgi:PPOX class probable F420-dependent enzyme